MTESKIKVKLVNLIEPPANGVLTYKMQCPKCKVWGYIDDDQYHGKVSIDCTECGFHETHDLSKVGDLEDIPTK